MSTTIEHLGITPGLSPWLTQIAMLNVRRADPEPEPKPEKDGRSNPRCPSAAKSVAIAKRNRETAKKSIERTLAVMKPCRDYYVEGIAALSGLSIDHTRRILANQEEEGRVKFSKGERTRKLWRLA